MLSVAMYFLRLTALALAFVVTGFAQTDSKPPASPSSTPLRVLNGVPVYKACGAKNPPPCASVPPKPIFSPDPNYTSAAMRRKFEGTAIYALIVNSDGRVLDVKQKGVSLGYGLDEEGIKALKKWKFKPAMAEGKPVAVSIEIEMEFRYSQN